MIALASALIHWFDRSRSKTSIDELTFSRAGNFALIAALLAPLVLGLIGGAIDLMVYSVHRTELQQAADAAALAATREASLKGWNANLAESVAQQFLKSNLATQMTRSEVSAAVAVDDPARTVDVEVTQDHAPYFLLGYFKPSPQIRVHARAQANGQSLICVIVTAPSGSGVFKLKGTGRVDASECSAYSNSSDTKGIVADKATMLRSKLACSSGGYSGKPSNFAPVPLTDCPAVSDPLSDRAHMIDAVVNDTGCDFQKLKIAGERRTLSPGTYCKDLRITKNSEVTLSPGIYVFKDGKIRVDGSSKLFGEGVGFVFVGSKSSVELKNDTTISLTAATSGPMAGILVYGQPSDKLRDFKFESKNAQKMVGTVYLPADKLTVGGDNDGDGVCDPDLEGDTSTTVDCEANVGTTSAWTAIVAERVEITAGASLILNAAYDDTSVPVPLGLGPSSESVALIE